MTEKDVRQRKTGSEQIIETVASWPNITAAEGRFNSTSFELAGREIGHLHPRLADIDYPKPLRDELITEGQTEEHHAVPMHPTATTFRIESTDDVDRAVRLFRLSYLVRVATLQEDVGAESDVTDIDVEKELDGLEPSDAIRRAFEAAVDEERSK
ncbi:MULTISPECIES: luciferase domain-containing protein [Natrialbaceae]|uniref:luciferase domain-containing protein n=1 Tax=Natrialbaceae TaxID=1644061 RepID=UPI00207D6325|nr:luciferase family protein [Natronococcus sp. CG52]